MALFPNPFAGQTAQTQQPVLPRVPWNQNPLVTSIGLGLLGGRNINEGLANAAAAAPAGMAAKSGMQQFMLAQQEKTAERDRQKAAWNAGMKQLSGVTLSPEEQSALGGSPEIALKIMELGRKTNDPLVVGKDAQVYDPATGTFKAPPGGGPVSRPDFSDVSGFRKEIQALPSYKNVAQAKPIFDAMVQTFPNKTRASDLNLVYGLGKIMDPGSVVREGEMVMVKDTASLPDWLIGEINRVNGGAALQEDTRRAILAEAKTRMDAYMGQWSIDAKQYSEIATRYNIPVEDAIPTFGPMPVLPGVSAVGGPRVAPAQQPSAPPGVPVDWRTYFGG